MLLSARFAAGVRAVAVRSLCATRSSGAPAVVEWCTLAAGTGSAVGLALAARHVPLRPAVALCQGADWTEEELSSLTVADFDQPNALSRILHGIGMGLVCVCSSPCLFLPIVAMVCAGAQISAPIDHWLFSTMRIEAAAGASGTVTPLAPTTCCVHDCCVSPCVSGATFGIGNYLWAFLDPDGQTLSERTTVTPNFSG